MDGIEQAGIRMLLAALAHRTCYVGAGSHTLTWAYLRGGMYAGGPAGVDQVTFTTGGTATFIARLRRQAWRSGPAVPRPDRPAWLIELACGMCRPGGDRSAPVG